MDSSLQSLPPSCGLLPCVSVSVSKFSSPDKDPSHTGFRATLLYYDRILITFAKIQIRSNSWVPGGHEFLEDYCSTQYTGGGNGGVSGDETAMMAMGMCGKVVVVVLMWG